MVCQYPPVKHVRIGKQNMGHLGSDLLPLIRGKEAAKERSVFWRADVPRLQGACRKGPWKYLYENDLEYLFHLGRDPGERNNLSDENPERLEEMRAEYLQWSARMLPVSD